MAARKQSTAALSATAAKMKAKPKAKKPKAPPGPLPPLPSGTEAMLGPSEAAAALGMRYHNFRKLVLAEKVPKPDGVTPWGKTSFWKQSTINAFIESLVTKRNARPESLD